jgi:signal transduction histidine kinase
MEWPYEYTPYIWPMLISGLFIFVLGIHGIRHRTAPGAVPFIILMAFAILWLSANALRLAGTDDATRIFWLKFEVAFLLPMASAALCLALEYAGLGRWLTWLTLAVLVIVPLAFVLLILTNEMHHLVWTQTWIDGSIHIERGTAHWIVIVYGFSLSLVHLAVIAWLFVHFPRHRWIAAGLFISPLIMRAAALLNVSHQNPIEPLNPMVMVLIFTLLPYALAFFRLRMFEVVPVARNTVIDRMTEGMMVLDAEKRIADVNEAVRTLLGIEGAKIIGGRVEDALQAFPDILAMIDNPDAAQREMPIGSIRGRWYHASILSLFDRRGFRLGYLIWFYDITDQRNARAQILDQQRTLAMLNERELLARDLHDGIGQMIAAAHLQAKSASELLAKGETVQVESCLRRLADITQEAKESVHEYLLGVKIGLQGEQGLLSTLRHYLKHYSQNYGIRTELVVSPELKSKRIDSIVEIQLQPIILEALTNVRKHAEASSARVNVAPCDGQVRITIEDDGRGFDPKGISAYEGFGLRSMRGRAEAAEGGLFEVNSAPGKGTRVTVCVPLRKEEP